MSNLLFSVNVTCLLYTSIADLDRTCFCDRTADLWQAEIVRLGDAHHGDGIYHSKPGAVCTADPSYRSGDKDCCDRTGDLQSVYFKMCIRDSNTLYSFLLHPIVKNTFS